MCLIERSQHTQQIIDVILDRVTTLTPVLRARGRLAQILWFALCSGMIVHGNESVRIVEFSGQRTKDGVIGAETGQQNDGMRWFQCLAHRVVRGNVEIGSHGLHVRRVVGGGVGGGDGVGAPWEGLGGLWFLVLWDRCVQRALCYVIVDAIVDVVVVE